MDRRIQHVLRYLEQNFHRRLRLRDLASSVHLSPTRFSHLFHSETGLSPREYIRQLRLNKAKQLLATTFLRVKEIAAQVGYGSSSQFARDFKQAYGITARQYRHKPRAELDPGRSPADAAEKGNK